MKSSYVLDWKSTLSVWQKIALAISILWPTGLLLFLGCAFDLENSSGYPVCRYLRQPYFVGCDVRASSAALVDWDHYG
jgi:hypothetical protein